MLSITTGAFLDEDACFFPSNPFFVYSWNHLFCAMPGQLWWWHTQGHLEKSAPPKDALPAQTQRKVIKKVSKVVPWFSLESVWKFDKPLVNVEVLSKNFPHQYPTGQMSWKWSKVGGQVSRLGYQAGRRAMVSFDKCKKFDAFHHKKYKIIDRPLGF